MTATAGELASLAGMYRLLARLWIREVDENFLSYLIASPVREVFAAAGGVLPCSVDGSPVQEAMPQEAMPQAAMPQGAMPQGAMPQEAILEELAVDYCQLFLGPTNHLPPFQSVWQTAQFQAAPASSMRRYVEAVGLQEDGMMLDHLGIQFDVMARILEVCLANEQPTDDDDGVATIYFAEHLSWVEPLFSAAATRARTEMYRSVILMTREFLASERAFWMAERV